MPNVRLNQKDKSVLITADTVIESELLFELLDKTAADLYDDRLNEVINLGSYGLLLDENASMLDAAGREIRGGLTQLNKIFEIRGLKTKGTAGGAVAEDDALQVLRDHASNRGWVDIINNVGNKTGAIPGRKVGDLVVEVEGTDSRIVLESKLDKSLTLTDYDKKPESQRDSKALEKTVYGQALLGLANRGASIAIHIADVNNCHSSLKKLGALQIYPEVPVILALVNPSTGDWSALKVAYEISRSLITAWENPDHVQWDRMPIVFERLRRELQIMQSMQQSIADAESTARGIAEQLGDLADSLGELNEQVQESQSNIDLLSESLQWIKDDRITIDEQIKIYLE